MVVVEFGLRLKKEQLIRGLLEIFYQEFSDHYPQNYRITTNGVPKNIFGRTGNHFPWTLSVK